ncbi:MAG: YqgE/AlgH family protein [Methylococcaceae bacterium]|nr:YqgE/AlgH family protein [Methylococcaceae bacterium]
MIETLNVTGHFLMAMPGMGDPNFHRTVTYMCQHSHEGALGIVINRPTDLTLGDILQQMSIGVEDERVIRIPVYYGGPVQPERGFVIHQPKGNWDSSLEVSASISLTTSRDILEAIAMGEGPDRFVVALGYAGWGEGQLEREIVQNAWLNAPAKDRILFELPADQRWKSAARQMGVDIDRLSSSAGHG